MFTSNHVESPRVCPRCKVVLPPGEVTCYSCGFRLAQSFLPSSTAKDQSRKQSRGVCIYFISIALVIFLFAFLLIRASGFSLSTYLPFPASTHSTAAYPMPKETPLFSDDFLSDDNGWNLQSSPGIYAVTLGHGTLTMEIELHTLLWELIPGERTYSDFILTANAVLSRGDKNDGYGVYIRGTANQASDLATYYRFELYGDGSYAIIKGILDKAGHSTSTTIAGYTLNPIIQPYGKLNHLMIIARGSALSFMVNGQLLKTIKDPSYTNGSVALFVSNLPQAKSSAQVQFSQLAIYPVQA
jgi:hypothetical protein